MAGGGDSLLERVPPVIADEQTHVPPRFALVEAIQTMAGADTSLAAGALVQVHLEGVLLAGRWLRERNEVAVMSRVRRFVVTLVPLGEPRDRGKVALLFEQIVGECAGHDGSPAGLWFHEPRASSRRARITANWEGPRTVPLTASLT